jgi:hypothetical protein
MRQMLETRTAKRCILRKIEKPDICTGSSNEEERGVFTLEYEIRCTERYIALQKLPTQQEETSREPGNNVHKALGEASGHSQTKFLKATANETRLETSRTNGHGYPNWSDLTAAWLSREEDQDVLLALRKHNAGRMTHRPSS